MGLSRHRAGFSLVEVVLALGVVVFAGFALIALLTLGLKSSSDSKEQLQAATIAEAICSTRRAAPTQDFTSSPTEPNFPLPVLSTSSDNLSSSPIYLTRDGTTTTLASGNARFGLFYKITAPANYVPSTFPGAATVYLCLYWPAQALATSQTLSHFEVTTTFALP